MAIITNSNALIKKLTIEQIYDIFTEYRLNHPDRVDGLINFKSFRIKRYLQLQDKVVEIFENEDNSFSCNTLRVTFDLYGSIARVYKSWMFFENIRSLDQLYGLLIDSL